jgi:hypothetical protein
MEPRFTTSGQISARLMTVSWAKAPPANSSKISVGFMRCNKAKTMPFFGLLF